MAQAVKSLWPQAKLAIGPAIEDGFYYDFDKSEPFSEEDLQRLRIKCGRSSPGTSRFSGKS
jgi:threonyl-tRNA synthetase